MLQDEGESQVDQGQPGLLSQQGQLLDRLELGDVRRPAQVEPARDAGAAVRHRRFDALAVAAGQPPAGQRAPRDHRQAVALRYRQDLPLDAPGQDRVGRLLGHDALTPAALGDPLPLDDVRRLEGRRPDIADLSLVDEVAESAEGLVEVGARFGAVDLVEVDPVGPQPAQAVLDLEGDPPPGVAAVVGPVTHHPVELRREHHLVAAATGEGPADDLLGLALRVDVRGVDDVDARVERAVNDRDALVMVGIAPGAEHHGPECQRTDLDSGASERAKRHVPHSPREIDSPLRHSPHRICTQPIGRDGNSCSEG